MDKNPSINRLYIACNAISHDHTKVLGSNFKANSKKSFFGNIVRRILLGLPGIKSIAAKHLAVTSPSYVAKKLVTFSKENRLKDDNWKIVLKAFDILKNSDPKTDAMRREVLAFKQRSAKNNRPNDPTPAPSSTGSVTPQKNQRARRQYLLPPLPLQSLLLPIPLCPKKSIILVEKLEI